MKSYYNSHKSREVPFCDDASLIGKADQTKKDSQPDQRPTIPAPTVDPGQTPSKPAPTTPAAAKTGTAEVTAKSLYLRSLPSTDGKVLTTVHRGDVLQTLAQEGHWYKVTIEGKTGWVSSGSSGEYLSVR